MTTPQSFDLLADLPTGTTLLEASAGTGKTYTIAALATRYIAQGLTTIDQMLMITFGRSATRELRERVRASLTTARDALRSATPADDPVVRHLLALPGPERQRAADRLARAVADFDAGTIATTHQFCLHALSGLGIMADTDPGEVFVESLTDLIDEVVDDFYIRKYGGPPSASERIPYEEARALARQAVGDPQAALDAGPVQPGSIQQTRLAFAEAVRTEVVRRRRARRLITFDDLVLRLQDALVDEAARQRLRDNYQVVLVDEFQDTDPAQWTILRRAFHGHRTLILIGDPKQAIYAFRGADVFSYLDAANHADHKATLPTNWRSDAAVVSGVQALLGGLQLGDAEITVHPVSASHTRSRLVGVPEDARVRLRTLCPEEPPGVEPQREAVAADVAADIVALLEGPARLQTGTGERPVAPADIAVLVGTHRQASHVHDALTAAGVPVVVNSSSSVFATPAATAWAQLLKAMQRPRGAALRDVALTDFVGHTPRELATAGEQIDTAVAWQMRAWGQVLQQGSVAQMVATMERDGQVAARVLSRPGGERDLTDLRHVAGALHAYQRRTHTGLVGLADWLTDQIRRATESEREPTSELTRRLETDAQAVQVLTVHTSKGLEFPVAYVPFAWDRGKPGDKGSIRCHDTSGRRVLDVRGEGAIDRETLVAARNDEDAAESLRQLYVALTRASSLLVVHWASSKQNTRFSPLHRALSAQLAADTVPAPWYTVNTPPALDTPWVRMEVVETVAHPTWSRQQDALPELAVAAFTRIVDTTWRRTSYSGLTRAVHEAEHAPNGFRDDEPEELIDEPMAANTGSELRSPFADLPAGAAFGTLVHAVLEVVDTDAADLPTEVATRCAEQLLWHPVSGVSADTLAQALLPAISTPLGPLADDLTLAGIPGQDRLSEMDFEFPMGAHSAQTLTDVADLLRRHLPADDPLAPYADRLQSAVGTANLVGYLSGSIDAVLRVGARRFLVVDYKTNLLRDPASPGAETHVGGYRPQRLATAMMDSHYPLQALLYSVALHRYLRWRLPGYDPAEDLGGVLYLFLRGMAGAQTPTGCGVFTWRPPGAMIVELSDLLDGRRP